MRRSELIKHRMKRHASVFALAAGICLALALVAATYSTFYDDRTVQLLSSVKGSKVSHPVMNKNHNNNLPPALLAAQNQERALEKQHREAVLARAAKNALQEYSSLQKKASDELSFEDQHIKSLVNSAAKELIAEEAMDKAKRAAAKKDVDWSPRAAVSHEQLSPAARWRLKMKEAEQAALDVIEKNDKRPAASQWTNYVSQQRKLIQKELINEKKQEEMDNKHIEKLIQTGKLTPTSVLKHSKLSHAQQLEQAKKERELRADEMAKEATEKILKRDAQSRATSKIVNKQLPKLEKHLQHETSSISNQKHWHNVEMKAKISAAARTKKWVKLIETVHKKQAALREKELQRSKMDKLERAKLQKVLKSSDQQHLDKQVDRIVGADSNAATQRRNKAQAAAVEKAKLQHTEHKALKSHPNQLH